MTKNKIIFLILVFLYLIIFFYEVNNIGLIWDEYDYIQSSQNHLKLLKNFFSLNNNEKKKLIEFGFQHPAFIRWIQGLCYKYLKIFDIPYINFRVGNIFFLFLFFIGSYILINHFFNVEIYLIFLILNLLNLKTIFYYSVGAMDFAVVSFYILTAALFLLDFNKKTNIIFFIISVSLGFAAKLNYVIILFPCLLYSFFYEKKKFFICILSIFFMFFSLYLFYPFLWSAPIRHLKQYLLFHLRHFQNYEYYFHKIYNPETDVIPWHYPIIHFLTQNSELSIITGLIGTILFLKNIKKKENQFLLFVCWLPLLLFFKPNTPCYNGIRLFLQSAILVNIFSAYAIFKIFQKKKLKYFFFVGLLFLLNLFNYVKYLKYPGSYYNSFICGAYGAEKFGLQIDVWGENLTIELCNKINQIIPDNKKIAIIGNHPNTAKYLQEINILKKTFILNPEEEFIVNDINKYDYLIVLNNKSLWNSEIFSEIKKREKIIYSKKANGIELVYILRINK
ncbi:MAG TPA: hypothetical protein PLD27_03940 [bacterium]|nr:hypothetical protein [bacterium]HOL47477.1 hypothetical protein [bacterium]HPQ18614.1 hypothetical protein [bacterium]